MLRFVSSYWATIRNPVCVSPLQPQAPAVPLRRSGVSTCESIDKMKSEHEYLELTGGCPRCKRAARLLTVSRTSGRPLALLSGGHSEPHERANGSRAVLTIAELNESPDRQMRWFWIAPWLRRNTTTAPGGTAMRKPSLVQR